MTDDDWVTVAMADDTLVVQLLLQLNQVPPPPPLLNKASAPALRLDWSMKQRRSKQLPRKKADAARASPSTPLSWSGGTSVSGCAADGFEECKPIDTARSKVAVAGKRSRKKKTLPELKAEESLLSKESKILKNQLATLRLTVEKQRAANESLKRLKVDLLSRQTPQIISATVTTDEIDSIKQIKVPCDPTCSIVTISPVCNKLEPSSPNASSQKQEVGSREYSLVLPDLNLPVEDNLGSNILYGIS